MTLRDMQSALEQQIRERGMPLELFQGGLLGPNSIAFWLSTGLPPEQIGRETLDRQRWVITR
jgi:hypothetical protein